MNRISVVLILASFVFFNQALTAQAASAARGGPMIGPTNESPQQSPSCSCDWPWLPECNDMCGARLFGALQYRLIGPHRGGRVTAVTGVPSEPFTFYMGSTGGGVWKTTDAGETWINISDGYFEVGSVGAIAVADSDPNVVYAGTGSAKPRGNVSSGRGIYRSTDAGKTWTHIGLREAGQIGAIRVHPANPDLVYVAALGHIFGPNEQRGVFRSGDGGQSWEKVLYVSERTGIVDLAMDGTNPRVLYAAAWTAERKPWTLISSSTEGGIYKTTDGGEAWTKLTNGLPAGLTGRIGVAVSPVEPKRVWALVEAEADEGLYRSEDAGQSFVPVNLTRKMLMARPWYYTIVVADPKDPDTVYLLNERFFKSVDAGKTFEIIPTPHGDNQAVWINPDYPHIMVEGNDGGVNVTLNGGKTWTTQLNQPTSEFYMVTVDNQFPYRVYGPQQDNSTISVLSRIEAGLTPTASWYAVGGCETGPIAFDPNKPDVVYAGCYGGRITRFDRQTGQSRQVMLYPQLQLGQSMENLKYRYQWNSPIRVSPHDGSIVYHASQYVHRSTDSGQSWEIVSPDLSFNDPEHQGYSGGPVTHDITGVEIFGTVFALEESPHEPGVIWAGTNDGRLHITRDNGTNWTDVTPEALPRPSTINRIEISPHDPAQAYVAVYRYRLDDFQPYVFRTNDYGATWARLAGGDNGIPAGHPVRVVREDPARKGLLYVGTEFGMFISFDDGESWRSFQLNLPATPITDLKVHRDDLVVATQGRSFWILDDLTPLHQMTNEVAGSDSYLFKPRDVYRMRLASRRVGGPRSAQNPPEGALIFYTFKETPSENAAGEDLLLEIIDVDGNLVRRFSNQAPQDADSYNRRFPADPVMADESGMNRLVWDLRYPRPDIVPSARPGPDRDIIWGSLEGPRALPGTYRVRLTAGDSIQTRSFRVLRDPRVETTPEELKAQFDLIMRIRDTLTEAHDALRTLRSVREQVQEIAARLPGAGSDEQLHERARVITDKLNEVEQALLETRPGDVAKLEPKLSSQLAWLSEIVDSADARPTDSSYERFNDLRAELDAQKDRLGEILRTDVADFNETLRGRVGPVILGTVR